MSISIILYIVAIGLTIYIIVNVIKEGKFSVGDTLMTLGILVAIIIAQASPNPVFPQVIPIPTLSNPFKSTSNVNETNTPTPASTPSITKESPNREDDPTDTPIPKTSNTPTPIPNTPAPTKTPKPTNTPRPTLLPTPTIDADPTVYDNFENPANDGLFNQNQWEGWAGSNTANFVQQNGVLNITTKEEVGLIAREYVLFPLENSLNYETKIKLSSNAHTGNIGMKINVDLPGGGWWVSECNIGASASDDQGWAYCSEAGSGGGIDEFESNGKRVDFDTLHTFHIKIDPVSMNFEYYIDEQLVGKHIPANAPDLQDAYYSLVIGSHSEPDIIGTIDSVRIW